MLRPPPLSPAARPARRVRDQVGCAAHRIAGEDARARARGRYLAAHRHLHRNGSDARLVDEAFEQFGHRAVRKWQPQMARADRDSQGARPRRKRAVAGPRARSWLLPRPARRRSGQVPTVPAPRRCPPDLWTVPHWRSRQGAGRGSPARGADNRLLAQCGDHRAGDGFGEPASGCTARCFRRSGVPPMRLLRSSSGLPRLTRSAGFARTRAWNASSTASIGDAGSPPGARAVSSGCSGSCTVSVQNAGISPWSKLDRHRWSVLNRRRHYLSLSSTCLSCSYSSGLISPLASRRRKI